MTVWEYFLYPMDRAVGFSKPDLEEMRKYVAGRMSSIQTSKSGYYIFPTPGDRDEERPEVLENPRRFYEVRASLHFRRSEIMVCTVQDPDTDVHLRDFVAWCLTRWPLEFHQGGGGPTTPDHLLSYA